jgi:hypothetical protein
MIGINNNNNYYGNIFNNFHVKNDFYNISNTIARVH